MHTLRRVRGLWSLAFLTGAALLMSCHSDKATGPEIPSVAHLSLSPATDSVLVGDSITLQAAVEDQGGLPVARSVAWTSSDPTLATVSQAGVLIAHDGGVVTVTATVDALEATAEIHLLERVSQIAVAADTAHDMLRIRDTLWLHVQLHDPHGSAVQRRVTWASSDEQVVSVGVNEPAPPAIARGPAANTALLEKTVDGGGSAYLLAVGPGSAIVTAAAEGLVDSVTVSVAEPVAVIEVGPASAAVGVGKTLQLQVKLLDRNQQEVQAPVRWASADTGIVAVDSAGLLHGVKLGNAVVTATADDRSAGVNVQVVAPAAAFTVAPGAATFGVGDTLRLIPTITDGAGTVSARTPLWSTDRPDVASVDGDGLVHGVGVGTAAITGTVDDLTATATVTVYGAPSALVIEPAAATIPLQGTVELEAVIVDSAGTPIETAEAEWTSSDPTAVSVSTKGLAKGLSGGPTTVTAKVGAMSATAVITVTVPVVSVSVSPRADSIVIGDTLRLSGVARDAYGRPVQGANVLWTSNRPGVASVDGSGLVTAAGEGTAVVSATQGGFTASASITVFQRPAAVLLSPGNGQIRQGDHVTMHATLTNDGGQVIAGKVTWASSDPGVATVSSSGMVTGVADGTATIAASSGGKTGSATIVVSGPLPAPETAFGNNLSVPVVFSEGLGLTGLPVTVDGSPSYLNTALRPTAEENVVVATLPFFYIGNAPDQGIYYLQKTANTWQAEWRDGTATGLQHAEAAWGDNLTHHTWNTGAPIRVEVSLNDLTINTLTGYNMTVLSGSGRTEVQGTDGTTSAMTPTVFSVVPRLVVQKLSGENGDPVQTLVDKRVVDGLGAEEGPGLFGAEVNVGGRILYGYNLRVGSFTMNEGVTTEGWWRIAFVLDDGATASGANVTRNVTIDRVAAAEATDEEGEPLQYAPQVSPDGRTTWVDIYVEPANGQGGGGDAGGGGDVGPGNNLSIPVTFAEGIGLTGLSVTEDPGVRPASTEGITVGSLPFFYSGNQSDCAIGATPYFCQNGPNVWQAQWASAAGQGIRDAEVAWGDNLLHNTFNTHMNVHVEVSLTDLTSPQLLGYHMAVISGSGATELQGTDGTTASLTPMVYTRGARLTVQKLDDTTRAPIWTLLDQGVWEAGDGPGQFATEVSMGGTVVYSYNLLIQNITIPATETFHKYGWWRFTFTLDPSAPVPPNVRMVRLAASEEGGDEGGGSGAGGSGGVPSTNVPTLNANGRVTTIDVYIDKGGGGGGGGEHTP